MEQNYYNVYNESLWCTPEILYVNYTAIKKLIQTCYMLYTSIYRTMLKWQNYRNGEQITDCQWLRRKASYKRATGGWQNYPSYALTVLQVHKHTHDKTPQNQIHTHVHIQVQIKPGKCEKVDYDFNQCWL